MITNSNKKSSYINLDHQAYVVVGERELARDLVRSSCEEFLGHKLAGYADFTQWQGGTYSVDDARDLRTKQNRASAGNQGKFFLVVADSLTHEAQNALLKTLEEPTSRTFIFLVVPSVNNLLPTLLSRVAVVHVSDANVELEALAEDFLNSAIPARFEMIESIIGKDHPDRARARQFVGLLSKAFHKRYLSTSWTARESLAARELINAESYLGDPASLAKMILEHLALILPA